MISAREVEEAQFRPAGVGQVGYDEAAVDGFLDRAASTLKALEAGDALPVNAITSSDVVEATFPERPADSAAGYNLDDVDDLLDAVALRLFKSERNRGQARQQLADRDSQNTAGRDSFVQDAGQVGYAEAAAPELNDEPHRVDGDGQDVALRDEREESAARGSERTSVDAANVNADVASEPVAGGAAPENKRDDAVLPGQTMLNIDDSRGTSSAPNQSRNGEQPVWNGWEDPSAPAAQPAPAVETAQDDASGSSAYVAPVQTQRVWNGWEDPSAPVVSEADEASSASQDVVSAPSDAAPATSTTSTSTDAVTQESSNAPQSSAANDDSNDSRVADVVGAAGLGVAGVAAGHAVAERHERAEGGDERAVSASTDASTPVSPRSADARVNNDANAVNTSPRGSVESAPSAANTSQISGINPVGGDPVTEAPVENTPSAQVSSGPINPVGADVDSESTRGPRSASTQSDFTDNTSAETVAREDSANASTSANARPVADDGVRKDDVSRPSNDVVEAAVAGGATAGVAGLAHHESVKKDAAPHETVSAPEVNNASATDNTERVVSTETAADTQNADAAAVQAPSKVSDTARDGENSSSSRNGDFAGINPVGADPLEESVARGHSAPVSAGTQPAAGTQSATNHHAGMAAVGAVGGVVAGAAVSSYEPTNAVSRDEAQVPTQSAVEAVGDRLTTNDAVREATPVYASAQNDSDAANTSDVKPVDSPVTDDDVREPAMSATENESAATVPVTEEVSKVSAPQAASAPVNATPTNENAASTQPSQETSLDAKADDAPARRRHRTEAAAGVVGLGAAGALYEHERSEKQDAESRESAPASDVAAPSSDNASADAPREEFAADEPAQVVQETSSENTTPDAGSATMSSDDRVVYVNRDGFGEERTVSTSQPVDASQVASQNTDAQTNESTLGSENAFVSNDEAPSSSASASSGEVKPVAADAASVDESAAPEGNESAAAPVAEEAPVTEEISETIVVTDAPGTPGEVGWIAPTAADHYGVREDDLTESDDTTDAASAQSVTSTPSNSADDVAVQNEAQNNATQNRTTESGAQQNAATRSATDAQPASTKGDELAAAAAGTAAVGAAGMAVASHHTSGDVNAGQQKSDSTQAQADVQKSAATPGSQAADAAALSNPEQASAPVVSGASDDADMSQPQDAESVHAASSSRGEAEAKTPTSAPVESEAASTPAASQPASTSATNQTVPNQPVTTAAQGQTPVPTNPGSEDEVNFHPEYSEYVPGAVTLTTTSNTTSANDTTSSKAASDAADNAAAGQQPVQTSSAPYVKRPAASTQPEIDRGPDAGVLPLSLTNEENTVSNSEQASSVGRPEPIDAPSSIDGPDQVKQATSVPKREENEGALGFVRRLLKRS